jgi:hypothetical protein
MTVVVLRIMPESGLAKLSLYIRVIGISSKRDGAVAK